MWERRKTPRAQSVAERSGSRQGKWENEKMGKWENGGLLLLGQPPKSIVSH